MARYYFDVDGVAPSFDAEGEELPDNQAAWREATQFAAELFKDSGRTSRPGDVWRLVVSDADRNQLDVTHIHSEEVGGTRQSSAAARLIPSRCLMRPRSRTDRCRAASLRNASRSSAQVFASLVEAIERAALMPPKPAFLDRTFDACTPLGGRSPIFLRHRPVKLLDEEPTIPDLSQAVGDLDDLSQICSCGRIYLRCAQRSSARHHTKASAETRFFLLARKRSRSRLTLFILMNVSDRQELELKTHDDLC